MLERILLQRDVKYSRVDDAMDEMFGLSEEMRADFASQLERLDRKEHYFLDLAAEEGWPKDKLRDKITAIRAERTQITRSLEQTEHQLDTGRQIFYQSLKLLDEPGKMYRRSGEAVRAILNRTFFTRFYVNAGKVTGAEMREPFDILTEAYRFYKNCTAGRIHYRTAPKNNRSAVRSTSPTASTPHDRLSLIDSLASLFERGWSKPIMVGTAGFDSLWELPCQAAAERSSGGWLCAEFPGMPAGPPTAWPAGWCWLAGQAAGLTALPEGRDDRGRGGSPRLSGLVEAV